MFSLHLHWISDSSHLIICHYQWPSFWSTEWADFVGPETYTILDVLCKEKKPTKLQMYICTTVTIYLKREKKAQQITNLKKLSNATNIFKKCLYLTA